MHIIGIIAEYNPIHLGHIYQIKKAKEYFPNSIIILITNATFTQRGNIAILNKWDKTKICLDHQIDIIVELPFAYATQSADIFASAALKILNELKIDTLVFGSESNDLNKLETIVNTQLNNKNYNQKVQDYLKTGINYPTAMSKALLDILDYTITEPNDLLGLSYIKEIKKQNYPITPFTIQRIGNYHGNKIETNIANASLIRNLIQQKKDINPYIPTNTQKYLYKNLSNENYFPYLKYKILSTNDLSIYQTVEEGIENRIKKVINNSDSWEQLIQNIKTKRYTYNKINRMLVHILTSFTKEEANKLQIDYIRILGFNLSGKDYLNKIKKELSLPIITRYKKNISPLLDLEQKATNIYYLPIKPKIAIDEYKRKPIIKTVAPIDKSDIHLDTETFLSPKKTTENNLN